MKSLASFQLRGILTSTGSSVPISNDILTDTAESFTNETVLASSDDNSVKELMVASASGGTLTISQRGLDQSETKTTDTDLQHEFRAGTIFRVVSSASDLIEKDTGLLKVFADATARDAAITSPSNGMQCYLTAEGVFSDYTAGTWTNRGTSTTPNGSETVAGKFEEATQTETDDGDSVGLTGANLVSTPRKIGRSIQKQSYTHAVDTGVADAYVITLSPVPLAYVDGMRFSIEILNTNTGASTVNVNSIGVSDIVDRDGDALVAGQLTIGQVYDIQYEITNTRFVLMTVSKASDSEVLAGINKYKYITPNDLPVFPGTDVTHKTFTTSSDTFTLTRSGTYLLNIDVTSENAGFSDITFTIEGVNIPLYDGGGLYKNTLRVGAGDNYTEKVHFTGVEGDVVTFTLSGTGLQGGSASSIQGHK